MSFSSKLFKKLEKMRSRQKELENRLKDLSLCVSPAERVNLMKEYAGLKQTGELYGRYQDLEKDIFQHENLLSEEKEDKEFIALTQEELIVLRARRKSLGDQLKVLLIPKDPLDEKNVVMEIRPAAGGDEAALFCEDLFTMYSRYSAGKNWRLEIMSSIPLSGGGFKEIIFSVSGSFVYESLKYESGVHRVQRVPETETQGRVHTSTVTVVVLPSADAKAVKIHPSDLRVDTFRSSGAGGQHVNTTDSAVRVVHVPTKITVQCQDEKSQHANKEKAFKVLYARLYERERERQKQKESRTRLSQIGTGDRSEKIRTYNFPQSRVTDHRIGLHLQNLERVMAGELDRLVKPLKAFQEEAFLKGSEE